MLFPFESSRLADHKMGVFQSFLEVKFRHNSKKRVQALYHIRWLSKNSILEGQTGNTWQLHTGNKGLYNQLCTWQLCTGITRFYTVKYRQHSLKIVYRQYRTVQDCTANCLQAVQPIVYRKYRIVQPIVYR